MNINIKADIKPLNKKLTSAQKKQIPFATANAINQTAFQTRKQLQKDMGNTFRGGAAPFTKRGVLVQKATKKNLEGAVNFVDPMIKINWPEQITECSNRDMSHPMLTDDFIGIKSK